MVRADVRHGRHVAPYLDMAFEQAAIGIALVDFDGSFVAVNPALCELVGRPEDELLTLTWQAITHPDDVGPGEEEVAKAEGGGEPLFRIPKRYIRPDGQLVWVLLTVSLIRVRADDPGFLLTQVVDVTDQRRAEEAVAQLAAIVQSSEDAILSEDLDGTILSWNLAAERMYGHAAAEVLGRSITTLIPAGLVAEIEELLVRVGRGKSIKNLETLSLRKDNSTIDVSVTVSPILDDSGVVVGSSCIARDITAQKLMASDLNRALDELESALDHARTSEARSQRFLSDAAHHLRNPVAGIRACVETLLRGPNPSGSERLLAEIAHETSHISCLVDRLLRIARLEQGEPLLLESCDIVDLCRDQLNRAQSLAPQLAMSLTADEMAFHQLDPYAVREIVGNLLDNARRHALGRIDVSVVSDNGDVLVRVADDGPGLPQGAENHAFQSFVSLDGRGGSGLGLSVAKALADCHGGDLAYQGRTFVLRLRALAHQQ